MPTSFTVMTWNVENLFPPAHRISPRKRVTEEDYRGKLAYLADVIGDVAPDVLALQEIGGADAQDTQPVDDLQAALGGAFPHRAISTFPDGRLIRNAILSSLPIASIDHITSLPASELVPVPNWSGRPPITTMGRGAVTVTVSPSPNRTVTIVTLHLKSKLISYPVEGNGFPRFDTDSEDERARGAGLALARRTAEAVAVRSWLNARMKQGALGDVVVLGDFNDEPRAATSQLLLGPEDRDVTTPDRRDPVRLYNITDAVPRQGGAENDKWFLTESERFSRRYEGRREMLDHILVSRNLLGESTDMRDDRWRVMEVRSLVGSIANESVGDDPGARAGRQRPDHAPVYARFAL